MLTSGARKARNAAGDRLASWSPLAIGAGAVGELPDVWTEADEIELQRMEDRWIYHNAREWRAYFDGLGDHFLHGVARSRRHPKVC